jgi:hypothetical protein
MACEIYENEPDGGGTSRSLLSWVLLDADGAFVRVGRDEPNLGSGSDHCCFGREGLAFWATFEPWLGRRTDCLGTMACHGRLIEGQ